MAVLFDRNLSGRPFLAWGQVLDTDLLLCTGLYSEHVDLCLMSTRRPTKIKSLSVVFDSKELTNWDLFCRHSYNAMRCYSQAQGEDQGLEGWGRGGPGGSKACRAASESPWLSAQVRAAATAAAAAAEACAARSTPTQTRAHRFCCRSRSTPLPLPQQQSRAGRRAAPQQGLGSARWRRAGSPGGSGGTAGSSSRPLQIKYSSQLNTATQALICSAWSITCSLRIHWNSFQVFNEKQTMPLSERMPLSLESLHASKWPHRRHSFSLRRSWIALKRILFGKLHSFVCMCPKLDKLATL